MKISNLRWISFAMAFTMLIGLLISGCANPFVPTPTATNELPVFKSGSGKLAFSAQKTADDQYEIYSYDLATKSETQLTKNGFADIAPSWSPDGKNIAFASVVDGTYQLFSINAEGKNSTRLIRSSGVDDTQPAWMPGADSAKLAYQSNGNGDFDICILDLISGFHKPITNSDAQETQPAWSPDGKRITFVSNQDGDFEIFIMDADGRNPVQITKNKAYDSTPVWSPDGKQIAFISKRDPDQNFQLFLINADGSKETQLTKSEFTNHSPAWSPDGKYLAFVNEASTGSRIVVMDLGTNQLYLVNSGAYEYTGLSWVK